LARDGGVSAVCTVAVRFAPTAPGSAAARLVIQDNAGGQQITQTVPLSGTGQSPATATTAPATAVSGPGDSDPGDGCSDDGDSNHSRAHHSRPNHTCSDDSGPE